jgi:type IV fimbrial biogenesis protein FimT
MDIAVHSRRAARARLPRGFTLLELLTTLSLMTIVATMVVPSFVDLIKDNRIVVSMNRLVTALQLARSLAVRAGDNAILCPSRNGLNCARTNQWKYGWIIFSDPNHNNRRDPGEIILRRDNHAAQLDITSGRRTYRIRYFSDGTSYFSNTTFVFCDDRGGASARAVILSNGGRPRSSDVDPYGGPLRCPH